jgi:hypothetical protein
MAQPKSGSYNTIMHEERRSDIIKNPSEMAAAARTKS